MVNKNSVSFAKTLVVDPTFFGDKWGNTKEVSCISSGLLTVALCHHASPRPQMGGVYTHCIHLCKMAMVPHEAI